MAELITSGRIADIILAMMAVEAVVLVMLRRGFGIGPSSGLVLAILASGAGLALAYKAAVAGAPWSLIAAALTLSCVAHIASLIAVWRR